MKPPNLLPDAGTDEPSGWVGAITLKLDEKPDPNGRGLDAEVGLVSGFVEPVRTDGEILESVALGGRFGVDEAGRESFEVSCCFVPKPEKADVVAAEVKPFVSYCFGTVPKLEKVDVLEAGLESFEVS